MSNPIKARSCFVSDLHLGSKSFQAELFLDFLKKYEFEFIYIVGDFIDICKLKRKHYWPQSHTDVLRKILKRSKVSKVFYLIGNHDEFGSEFFGEYGNLKICESVIHTTINGDKILIIHGHQFDAATKHAKWIVHLGDIAYDFLLWSNNYINWFRRLFGLDYWSLSKYAKAKVKNAVSFISGFESAVSHYAELNSVKYVLAGHIHTPVIKKIKDIIYMNCGDWIESCSFIVELNDGTLELVNSYRKELNFEENFKK